jgi:hypothetical protein
MDNNEYTWNSSIGLISRKQFILFSVTICIGSSLIATNNLFQCLLELGSGFIVLLISFQVLMWRNDINNYLLFIKGSVNKRLKNTLNIYGDKVESQNLKDESIERYLDIYGSTSHKVKSIIGISIIILISFGIQHFIIKEYSFLFYMIVALGAYIV